MKKDGGPAFPTDGIPYEIARAQGFAANEMMPKRGMSLRAYFAGQALIGVLAQWGSICAIVTKKHEPMMELDEELAALRALKYADALIAELERE